MSYPKPLSEKSLQKMYTQVGINEKNRGFLHQFFLAAANLYGAVYVRDLWGIYKEYASCSGYPKLHRKDFISFSAIARRENLPYYVLEIDEIYSEEPRKELDRCVVLKTIVGEGYGKFTVLYKLQELQWDKPYYLPEDLLSYIEPQINEEEKELQCFLDNLRVEATQSEDRYGKKYECEHTGKCLNEFEFLNSHERFEVEYLDGRISGGPKRNPKKLDAYLKSRSGPESVKLLRDLKDRIMTGWLDPVKSLRYLLDELNEVGVRLSEEQIETLIMLINNFQNCSRLWCNRGWTPMELARAMYHDGMPKAISFGPGIEKMIADGAIDRNELVEKLMEMGIQVV